MSFLRASIVFIVVAFPIACSKSPPPSPEMAAWKKSADAVYEAQAKQKAALEKRHLDEIDILLKRNAPSEDMDRLLTAHMVQDEKLRHAHEMQDIKLHASMPRK